MDMDDELEAFERWSKIMAYQIRFMWLYRTVFLCTFAAIGLGAHQYLRDGGRIDMSWVEFVGTYPIFCGGLLLMLLLIGFGIWLRMLRDETLPQPMHYGLYLFGMTRNDNGQLIKLDGQQDDSSDEAETSDGAETSDEARTSDILEIVL